MKKQTYHHGALKQALVRTALEMLEETGLSGLSLRKVAARIGVSHAAPEHHFPSLRHLYTELAIEGFALFAGSMAAERKAAADDPSEQIRAAFRGYLSFATGHPQLFRLMFTSSLLEWTDDRLREGGDLAYNQLREICGPAADRLGLDNPDDRMRLQQLVWSQIHGQAHLTIDQKLPGSDTAHWPEPLDLASLLFR
jgi:AcrR family transcriptional regulator